MTKLYSSLFTTKTGNIIPVFSSGKTMESKYNPVVEADRLLEITEKSDFYIILGIGSGIFIEKLFTKYPNSTLLCVERTQEDLIFLQNLDSINKLNYKNIIFSTIENLQEQIIKNYIPAFYGSFKIIEQRAWIQENQDLYKNIKESIEAALHEISKDFSVQAHFGNIWHKNILNNFNLMSEFKHKLCNLDLNTKKTAAIIAAGPSLNTTIKELIKNRNNYFIISTDTAYSSLLKNNIIPEAVVSIDGQAISRSHFLHKNNVLTNTLFIFDLCSNFSAANHIFENNGKVLFSISGHPLSNFISEKNPDSFINLYSGSGTVTIAAFDFALKAGFSNIHVFGADFSYLNGLSYAKGTYLDSIYSINSNKLNTIENAFNKLFFRTELIPLNKKKVSTTVLNSYKESFENYLGSNNLKWEKQKDIYYVSNENQNKIVLKELKYTYLELVQNYINTQSTPQIQSIFELNNWEISFLPLISWLRLHDNKDSSIDDLFKTAHSFLQRK